MAFLGTAAVGATAAGAWPHLLRSEATQLESLHMLALIIKQPRLPIETIMSLSLLGITVASLVMSMIVLHATRTQNGLADLTVGNEEPEPQRPPQFDKLPLYCDRGRNSPDNLEISIWSSTP
jgi:hypothetical protein